MKITSGKFLCYAAFAGLVLSISCAPRKALPKAGSDTNGLQIAVLADVHFHDVYGQFKDGSFNGITNPKNIRQAIPRTMGAQLRSTRIFNENYFAFLAALDDLVKRNIKLVILPGDFSDDGQPIHLRGLKRILDTYSKAHGLRFFLITGNHDVVEPYTVKAGKKDFLGADGRPQPIMSKKDMYVSDLTKEHAVVVTEDIQSLGYLEVTELLGAFGFFPKKDDVYWESPFSDHNYISYTFKKAKAKSALAFRKYGSGKEGYSFPDISYVVEPVNGLWLLALDANVFMPQEDPKDNSVHYPGVSRGYNNVLEKKQYLIQWVAGVAEEAEKLGKTLITFSHYPMVDFNDGASAHIKNLAIPNQMQLARVPKEEVAQSFADAGVKLHFGGHMHLNDTGIFATDQGNILVNIQTPSLAAYKPAYKLVTLKSADIVDIQTVVLDSVPRFKELFDLYKLEHNYLSSSEAGNIWNEEVLSSLSYREYTNWHLKELVRLRFLPQEWTEVFIKNFTGMSGKDLLVLAFGNNSRLAADRAKAGGLNFERFADWTGFDFLFDLYRLRSADELARKDIGEARILQYTCVINSFLDRKVGFSNGDVQINYISELMEVFRKFLNSEPSDHLQVNLTTGQVSTQK